MVSLKPKAERDGKSSHEIVDRIKKTVTGKSTEQRDEGRASHD